jgi:tetratricopeptide (TPR) repeat protein
VLRATEALEARGDLAGAERLARDMLERRPRSLSSLIVLERLLTMQGRIAEIEPYVDTLLALDPKSVIGHQLQVRVYSTTNRPAELERAAGAWIAVSPDVETPYREIARTYRMRGDLSHAADVLEQGRRRLGGAALALELGDLYAEQRDYDRAVAEWSHAIGEDGQGLIPVQRRVQALPGGGVAAVPALVRVLTKKPTSLARRRTAAELAVDAALVKQADELARDVYDDLPDRDRAAYIVDIARRADASQLTSLAYWAYGVALKVDHEPSRALTLRTRYAQLALAVGDTSKATDLYRSLENAAAAGSPQRRQALGARIELAVAAGDTARALQDLLLLKAEFGSAPGVDAAAALVGTALLERGNLTAAQTAVAGVNGARSGATRGRIFLRQGQVEKAREELLSAAPLLQGAEATAALTLATLILRISDAGGELISRVMGVVADDPAEAVRLLLEESNDLPPNERAPLLDYAASIADHAGLAQQAERVRREIIAKYPTHTIAPAALLGLARSIMSRGGSPVEAQKLLESLILDHPRSALVPQARRELDVLAGRVPGN